MAFDLGETASALALHRDSLAIRHELGDRWGIAMSLEGLASVVSASEAPEIAARIWGAAESLRKEIGTPLPPSERPRFDQMVAATRAAMGDDQAFDSCWQAGRTMTAEQAIGYALKKKDANP